MLSAVILAATIPAAACTASPADTKAVSDTVHAFYEAERTGDSAGWSALTTPDFHMFHEGENLPPGDFVKFIDHAHAIQQQYQAVWTMDVTNFQVSIGCTTALTTLTLHNVEDASVAKTHPVYDETFLESFWLRKVPGASWRIAFWNASKVAKPAPNAEDRK